MTCHKLAFGTVEAAERTASVIAGLRNGAGKVPVRIYECPDCGCLHFTSRPQRHTPGDSTVATLRAEPAFVSVPTDVATPIADPCADCGAAGAKFELYGKKYHRKCRVKVIEAMTPEDRKAAQREQTWGHYIEALRGQGYTVIPPKADGAQGG